MNRPVRPQHLVERAAARLLSEIEYPPVSPGSPVSPSSAIRARHSGGTAEAESRPEIPMRSLSRAGMIELTRRSRALEEFRVAVSRLMQNIRDDDGGLGHANVTLVTSARPGEGKSFCSLNLAAALSRETTETVLLIDGDAKLTSLSYQLGLEGAAGLMDMAAQPALRPDATLHRTALHNLMVLPIGNAARVAQNAIDRRPIAAVIEDVVRRFPRHLVLIDAPPCLATSDATALAALARRVVLVVEAGSTHRNEVRAALDLLHACDNIMLLLNKADAAANHGFGGENYHGAYY